VSPCEADPHTVTHANKTTLKSVSTSCDSQIYKRVMEYYRRSILRFLPTRGGGGEEERRRRRRRRRRGRRTKAGFRREREREARPRCVVARCKQSDFIPAFCQPANKTSQTTSSSSHTHTHSSPSPPPPNRKHQLKPRR